MNQFIAERVVNAREAFAVRRFSAAFERLLVFCRREIPALQFAKAPVNRRLAALTRSTLTGVLLAIGPAADAQPTNAPPRGPEYRDFQIISSRNIFNPNRTARFRGGARREERQARTDSFALVGTIAYEKGAFAFFDGSDSDYKRVLESGGTVAGYRVAEIQPNAVKLEKDGKQLEMTIGSQMQREENGPWQLVARQVALASDNNSSAAATEVSADPSLESNDVLKRLMERKQQELQ